MFFPPLPLRAFYMIRHGETVANAEGYAAGALDTPLTERGRAQAEVARACLEALSPAWPQPTFIAHSALSRTRDTALCMNKGLGLPSCEEAGLGERSFGSWVYRPWEEVVAKLEAGEPPPGGETSEAFATRIRAALARVLEKEGVGVIVTHGGAFGVLGRSYACPLLDDVDNGVLYRFVPREGGDRLFPWQVAALEGGEGGLKEEIVIA